MSHWICSRTWRSTSFLQLRFRIRPQTISSHFIIAPSEQIPVFVRNGKLVISSFWSRGWAPAWVRSGLARFVFYEPSTNCKVSRKKSPKPFRFANVVISWDNLMPILGGIHHTEENLVRGIGSQGGPKLVSRCPQADRNHAVVEPFWISPFEVSWTIKRFYL